MNNKKYYPFKRNNYFYGKLLTVRDFEEEQKYLNDKRRITNVLTNGVGVVTGLTTLLINERTISVEAGLALDCMGREIVVEEAVTKTLNVIDGFDELDGGQDVYLCIEYLEALKEPVYSVTDRKSDSEGKNEYNRVDEGYKLYLTNIPLYKQTAGRRLIEEKNVIYEGGGIKITQITPTCVNPAQTVSIKIRIEKTGAVKSFEVDFYIRGDYLKGLDGNDFVHVYYKDDELIEYKAVELSYSMVADDVFDTDTKIRTENGVVNIGAMQGRIEPIAGSITITKKNICDVITKRYLSLHFDEALNMTDEIPIYLAKFKMIKQESEYFIKEFYFLPFDQYIVSNELLYTYLRRVQRSAPVIETKPVVSVKEEKKEPEISVNSGFEDIEIDLRCKNKTYFSGEIAHGLGKGDVFIQIGAEDYKNTKIFEDAEKMVAGDMSVLLNTPYETLLPTHNAAVITYTDKGTFRIAIKLLSNAEKNFIRIKWQAYKNNKNKAINFAEADTVSVSINEKSVSLATREKFKFNATVSGTYHKELRWSVVDKDGGEIDINGIYEAPNQEGVYEIMAQSVKYPHKKATTFVVVKQ